MTDDTAAVPALAAPAFMPLGMRPEDGSVTETYTTSGAEFSDGGTLTGYIAVEYSSTDDSSASATILSADLTADGQSFIYNVSGQSDNVDLEGILGPNNTETANLWQAKLQTSGRWALTLDYFTETPTTLAIQGQTGDSAPSSIDNFNNRFPQAIDLTNGGTINSVCYLRGTGILTARGEVPVETLCAGDVVATRFGPLRAVKWIGRQSFAGRFLGQRNAPVCFKAGSLGDNVPARDLTVSPAHSMLVGDRLVMASLLVNGVTITQAETSEPVDYFHIDLGVHDCVVANGAWSESYAEHGNRRMFHNHDEFTEAFPLHDYAYQDTCLPRIEGETDELLRIRAGLIERLPAECITRSPDLHLLADGRRIDGTQLDDRTWTFPLPAGLAGVRLVSHAAVPAALALGHDKRRLGFCISRMTLTTGTRSVTLDAGDPAFATGVHAAESNDTASWRWTDGDCLLPDILRAHTGDSAELTVTGYGLSRYLVAPARAEPPQAKAAACA